MVTGAATITTAAPYIGYAAICAADHNIQNIACINLQSNILYVNQYNLWLDISAIIVLVCIYGIGVGDSSDECAIYRDDGIGYLDGGGYGYDGIAVGKQNDDDMVML